MGGMLEPVVTLGPAVQGNTHGGLLWSRSGGHDVIISGCWVYDINYVVLDEDCKESAVVARPVGILSGTSRYSG